MHSLVDVAVPNYVAATDFWPRLALIVGVLVILLSFGLKVYTEDLPVEQFLPTELLAFGGFLAMGAGWLYAGILYVLFAPAPGVPEGTDPTFVQSLLNGPGVLFVSALLWLAASYLAALIGRGVGHLLRRWIRR